MAVRLGLRGSCCPAYGVLWLYARAIEASAKALLNLSNKSDGGAAHTDVHQNRPLQCPPHA